MRLEFPRLFTVTPRSTAPASRPHMTRCLQLVLLLMTASLLCTQASAQTGYVGIFGGGPLYKHVTSNIDEIENSGFTEVIVWSVEVSPTGDLNLNGEFPLTANGAYVGNQTYPNFPADLATMKQGSVQRVTLSIGSSNVGDWQNIEALVNAQGTGPDSILYKDFQALKSAIPSLDAIDFDDENNQDLASTTAFSVMLGNLGYKAMPDAYDNSSYWTSLVSQVNGQLPRHHRRRAFAGLLRRGGQQSLLRLELRQCAGLSRPVGPERYAEPGAEHHQRLARELRYYRRLPLAL